MLNHIKLRTSALAGLFAATTLFSHADEVITQNGSRINGTITGIENGILTIETEFAGILKIAQSEVASFSTEAPIHVAFEDGNRLVGTVSGSNGAVTVSTPNGNFASTVTAVDASWAEGTPSPEERALEAALPKWKYEVAAEFSGSSGNTEGSNIGFAGTAERKTDKELLRFFGNYRYEETDGSVGQDSASAGSEYQSEFYERTIWYVRAEMGRDNTKDLDLFAIAGAGLGYRVIEEENHNLLVKAGLAYRFENYGSAEDVSSAALDLGLEHEYIWGWGRVYTDLAFLPALDDFANYRLLHETGLEFPVSSKDGWKVRMGISNDYTSEPSGNLDELDTTYFTRLVYSWR